MEISKERLKSDIEANAEFGEIETENGRGRTLLTGSRMDKKAREYLTNRMKEAGMSVDIDPVGNIVGRWFPEEGTSDLAPLVAGSHLDSVPEGGIFDGPLGVYSALEAVRTIREGEYQLQRPIFVVSFTEEEGGRFGIGTLGSSVATGKLSVDSALALKDESGQTLEERLRAIGFNGSDEIHIGQWEGWLELHIEQGRTLERNDLDVGIVDAISGITNCQVTVNGESNHAGSTPMFEREDALTAASDVIRDVERIGRSMASNRQGSVATVGEVTINPNKRNIIPGKVDMHLDIRDPHQDNMDEMVKRVRQSCERIQNVRELSLTIDRYRNTQPTRLSDRYIQALESAATKSEAEAMILQSSGIHDTANVAEIIDSGLLFVPSRGGISHSPREWTDWDDCAMGCEVLSRSLRRLAR